MDNDAIEKQPEWQPPIEPQKSVPADIPSANPDSLYRDACHTLDGEFIRMEQSAAVNVIADDIDMQESAALLVQAEEMRVTKSATLILAAGEVRGDVTTIFTPLSAMIAGVAIMVGLWLIRGR